MALRFFNSLTRRVEDFVPLTAGEARLYTCGPTVYNFAHIGNFRAYLFEDLLRRTLEYAGLRVIQVMNLTDVDDKTIRGARQAGVPLADYTRTYKEAFFEDLRTLAIEPAEHYPAATDHIPEMIALVRTLIDKGFANVADDGSVYFSIARFPRYGQLVNLRREQMRPTERVRSDEYVKDAAADFALWKAYSEEDGAVFWDSPWGRGRPGWHIECSAMSMRYLGRTFDIHTGGIDNMFPHHENEIAQSEAANGCRFVNYWLHCAHLMVDGEKMAKSAGNFYTLRDLIGRGGNGREIRWVLLGTHYRQPLNFSFQACRDAKAALQRLDDFVVRLREAQARSGPSDAAVAGLIADAESGFRAGLDDDLNISEALGALFNFVRDANRLLDAGGLVGEGATAALAALARIDRVLGVIEPGRQDDVPPGVAARARERQEARKARDFKRADAIREALRLDGWLIEDTPGGQRLKRL